MPVREAKGRILVREYMADREFMRTFAADEREAYLLLSLFTDDAGWLNWDPNELAGAMYRYEDLDARESKLGAFAEHFQSTGRLKVYKCGHAFMPKVANRPRGMAREYAVRDQHRAQCQSTRKASGVHSESSLPPDLTLPDLTSTGPIPFKSSTPGAPAHVRGGRPKTAKEVLDETWGSKRKAGR